LTCGENLAVSHTGKKVQISGIDSDFEGNNAVVFPVAGANSDKSYDDPQYCSGAFTVNTKGVDTDTYGNVVTDTDGNVVVVDWEFDCDTGWEPVENIWTVPCIDATISGNNDVVYPVKNTTGQYNLYMYKCDGEYSVDTTDNNFESWCETGWYAVDIEAVPCIDSEISGYNDVVYPVENTNTGQHNPFMYKCDGEYSVDTTDNNFESWCETGWYGVNAQPVPCVDTVVSGKNRLVYPVENTNTGQQNSCVYKCDGEYSVDTTENNFESWCETGWYEVDIDVDVNSFDNQKTHKIDSFRQIP
jgi:hypothetical protein